MNFYTGLFPGSSIDSMARYSEAGPGVPGSVMTVNFHMLGQEFLAINGELRRKNAVRIASFAGQTSSEWLWNGVVFHPFTNTAVQSAFADRRTYIYQGREVDHQTHLGFDLASYAGTPIVAANRGKVLFADELGIYGNAVIIDHGLGVQSLYAHLSSIGVKVGDLVEKSQEIGRSGMTGMAGGDHLHFTLLVAGRMVNPIECFPISILSPTNLPTYCAINLVNSDSGIPSKRIGSLWRSIFAPVISPLVSI